MLGRAQEKAKLLYIEHCSQDPRLESQYEQAVSNNSPMRKVLLIDPISRVWKSAAENEVCCPSHTQGRYRKLGTRKMHAARDAAGQVKGLWCQREPLKNSKPVTTSGLGFPEVAQAVRGELRSAWLGRDWTEEERQLWHLQGLLMSPCLSCSTVLPPSGSSAKLIPSSNDCLERTFFQGGLRICLYCMFQVMLMVWRPHCENHRPSCFQGTTALD